MKHFYIVFQDAAGTRYLNVYVGTHEDALESIQWYIHNTAMKFGYIVAIADHSLPESADDYLINLEPSDGVKVYPGEGMYTDVYNYEKEYIEEIFIPYEDYFEFQLEMVEIAE